MGVVVVCLLNVMPTFIESSPCNALPASIGISQVFMNTCRESRHIDIRELRAVSMYDSISALMVVGSEFFLF